MRLLIQLSPKKFKNYFKNQACRKQANTYQALTHFEYSSSGHKSKFSYFAINFYYNWGIIGMDFWLFPVMEDDCIFHDYSIIGVSIIAEQTT